MMKVLLVSPFPIPGSPIRGGVEAVAAGLLKGFSRIGGIQVKVLSFCHTEDLTVRLYDNVEVYYVGRRYRVRKLELLLHAKKYLYKVFEEWGADILHIEGNGSSLLLMDRRYSGRTVVTQHGILDKERKTKRSFRSKMNLLLAEFIERRKRSLIKNIVFISAYNKNLYGNLDSLAWAQICNPLDDDYFKTETREGCAGFYFLGVLSKSKGVADLLEAYGSLGHSLKDNSIPRLDVIGSTDDRSFLSEMEKTVLGIKDGSVAVHGWKTGEQIRSIVESSRCLVLPSYQETLPVVVAEAMAMGKIVIASDVGGVREMVDDGQTGFLFKAGDVSALTNLMLKVAEMNEETFLQMSQKARQKAWNMFNSESVAQKTADFYERVLKQ